MQADAHECGREETHRPDSPSELTDKYEVRSDFLEDVRERVSLSLSKSH